MFYDFHNAIIMTNSYITCYNGLSNEFVKITQWAQINRLNVNSYIL